MLLTVLSAFIAVSPFELLTAVETFIMRCMGVSGQADLFSAK